LSRDHDLWERTTFNLKDMIESVEIKDKYVSITTADEEFVDDHFKIKASLSLCVLIGQGRILSFFLHY
jgi:hypothetical protein